MRVRLRADFLHNGEGTCVRPLLHEKANQGLGSFICAALIGARRILPSRLPFCPAVFIEAVLT